MFGGSMPSIKDLQRPDRPQDVMKEDFEDCLSCRLTGATVLIGAGAYSYYSGHRNLQLQQARILASNPRIGMKGRQVGITSIALSLVGLGMYRLIN
ncbi:hypothetical protein BJ878DRAFT_514181 [Calycina marina]|uniref:Distal membrane-arm assembly complex protein 1-like domain-containing protein n=1 Tax=Calycina marina TaxID=1763456 RepID=A0A9P8CDF5_9HELO|nr:hypothetical protein BJ878DRAFT_514181 [Calycina marina]